MAFRSASQRRAYFALYKTKRGTYISQPTTEKGAYNKALEYSVKHPKADIEIAQKGKGIIKRYRAR